MLSYFKTIRTARTALVFLMAGTFAHAPVAIAHEHAEMTAGELQVHLQLYHHNCPPNETPQGWHFHCLPLGLLEDGTDATGVALRQDRNCLDDWFQVFDSPCSGSSVSSEHLLQVNLDRLTCSAHDNMAARLPLFQLYQSLLI